MFTIKEDSGTCTGSRRRHDGYYAGDFTRTPMCTGQRALDVGEAAAPDRPDHLCALTHRG